MRHGEWGWCDTCGRDVPGLELLDAAEMPEFEGRTTCGHCRCAAVLQGVITRSELARRNGAGPEKVAQLEALEVMEPPAP